MIMRKAEQTDAARILEIIENAKTVLKAMGLDQWQKGYPNMDSILQDIRDGYGKVIEEGGLVIATAAVYVGNEPTYDVITEGNWLTDQRIYGIIHRIAVAPEAKGKGLAAMFVQHCTQLAKEAGLPSIRCDTHFGNTTMQHTLLKNGYTHCGTIFLADGSRRMAFEKRLPAEATE